MNERFADNWPTRRFINQFTPIKEEIPYYWESLNTADGDTINYDFDVFLYDVRGGSFDMLEANSETSNSKAFKNNQLGPWNLEMSFSYERVHEKLAHLIPILRHAKKLHSNPISCVENHNLRQFLNPGEVRCMSSNIHTLGRCPAESQWKFKDDRGEVSKSKEYPVVLAQAQAASALWDNGIGCGIIAGIFEHQGRRNLLDTPLRESTLDTSTECLRNFGSKSVHDVLRGHSDELSVMGANYEHHNRFQDKPGAFAERSPG